MAQQFNEARNSGVGQQPSGQLDPYLKAARRSRNRDNVAAQVAREWGVHPRTVYRAAEYHTAVTALAELFGADVALHILNRTVRLNHRAVVNLSKAAQGRYCFMYAELGDAIRSGNNKMVDCYVKLARNLK